MFSLGVSTGAGKTHNPLNDARESFECMEVHKAVVPNRVFGSSGVSEVQSNNY